MSHKILEYANTPNSMKFHAHCASCVEYIYKYIYILLYTRCACWVPPIILNWANVDECDLGG